MYFSLNVEAKENISCDSQNIKQKQDVKHIESAANKLYITNSEGTALQSIC